MNIRVLPPVVLTLASSTGNDGGTKSQILTGEGPPSESLAASKGDKYLDTLSGALYVMD